MRVKVNQLDEFFSFAAPLDFVKPIPYEELASRLRLMTLFANRLYVPMTFLLHNKEFQRLQRANEYETFSFLNDGRPIVAAPSTGFGASFEDHYFASRDSGQPATIPEKEGGLRYARFLDRAFPPIQLVEFGHAKRIRTFVESFREEASLLFETKKLRSNPVDIAIEEAERVMLEDPLYGKRIEIDGFSGVTRATILSYLDCPARQAQVVRRSSDYLREAARMAYASNVSLEFSRTYQMIVSPIVRPPQASIATEYVVQIVDEFIDDLTSRPPFSIGGYKLDFKNLSLVGWKDVLEKHLDSDEAKEYFRCKMNLCQDGEGTYENLRALASALHHYLLYLSAVTPPSGSRINVTLRKLWHKPIVREGMGAVTMAVILSKTLGQVVPGVNAVFAETLEFLASKLLLDRMWKNKKQYEERKAVEFSLNAIARRRPIKYVSE